VVAPIYIEQHAIIPAAGDRSTSIRRQMKTWREKLVDVPRISRADKLLAASFRVSVRRNRNPTEETVSMLEHRAMYGR